LKRESKKGSNKLKKENKDCLKPKRRKKYCIREG